MKSRRGNGPSRADPIVLNFHDTSLRMSDVQLLQGPCWLNDQILTFYFEYLEHMRYRSNSDMLFFGPDVTDCLKSMDDDEMLTMFKSLQALSKPFIFFAINPHEIPPTDGVHWSLLVFSRPEKTFYYFDAISKTNSPMLNQFALHIKDALNCRQCHIKPLRSVQHGHGYDCGIHVICMTDNVADYINRYECVNGVGGLHQDTISAKRSEVLKLVRSLGANI